MAHMDHSSTTSTTVVLHSKSPNPSENNEENNVLIFDASLLQGQPNIPAQFIWPCEDLAPHGAQDELQDPPIDLKGILEGDREAIHLVAMQIRAACLSHGFFQVINHGIGETLIQSMYQHIDAFFMLPLSKKRSIKRKPGGLCGYSGAHADRFSSKLPWKETVSFSYNHADCSGLQVVDYFKTTLGQDFEEAGRVYQKYCEEMKVLAFVIFELLAISLEVDVIYFRNLFEDGCSLMRANNYPPCKEAGLTFGTGPHYDPNALTILHQDEVGGLEIFADNKWQAVRPRPDAFVVNLGDTFMALCNGEYRSCLHRAMVNEERVRRSFVFFVNPKEDKVVSPPQDLLLRMAMTTGQQPQQQSAIRHYPDFTWSDLRDFTQNHYRADSTTLQNFVHWISSKP